MLSDEHVVVVPWVPPKGNAETCHPLTIFQLLQAEKDFTFVSLVAHVTSVDIHAGKAIFLLEDGTGRIYGEKFFKTLKQGQPSASASEEETSQLLALEHTYVEAIGTIRKNNNYLPRIQIGSIYQVWNFHQVMFHILHAVHTTMAIQQHIQPQSLHEDHSHIVPSPSPNQAILPSIFSPQKHQLYATLQPLEKAIMKHMHDHKNGHILISELAQSMQTLYGCTESQFNASFQELLSEAYITNPLDDEYVVVTPRH